ncbi:DsbA family protein [Polyangium jinanense]|uniref:Thioredoxin domain-containing protein n=1 Tax=Polyangium jinanense TaxID=2829994 RepID=A0A9X3X010_9BACT|nr:thioredoxin domain-containing protein [Polyangium jinanense]MDC3952701.1 thioredoxin domain-containing protein [Polyangium jinanense]MDC3980320.1 thioredoxin domain-containing protein [Polyangium jinanense]
MLVKLFRIGFVTALSAATACGQAPPPPAATPGAESQGTADKGANTATAGKGAEDAAQGADKGGAPRGAAEGDGERIAVAGGAGRGANDDNPGSGFPVRTVAPAEAGTWTGGNEVDTGEGAKSPVPVTAADPSWGSPKAPVTIVAFSDLECPFCARASGTLAELAKIYGKDQLRIVWKNFPLPFHKNARPAAEAAMAVFKQKGAPWFWAYHDALFAGRIDPQVIDGSLPRGITRKTVDATLASGEIGKKIDEDIELGKKIGVTGTPAFFINGVFLSGAQPIDKFRAIVDEQIAAGRKATASGTAPEKVYATLSAKNYQKPEDRPGFAGSAAAAEDTKTVWRVPVDGSPVRGKNTALVTLVMFTDFQCPFCVKVTPTLEQLARDYGDKLRIVYKNNPLPFHKDAEPAAELALEARAQKGDAGFWKAHDLLFAANGKLAPEDLEGIAKNLGLDLKKASDAIEKKKYKDRIEQDQDLADDVQASGTPHFFINGRRLVGAQPIEKFKALIDEEITKSEALVKKGTPAAKLYDTIIKDGKTTVLEKVKAIPAFTKDNPTRGPANAKVTVQIFSDFECPFCKRVEPTLTELEAAFPGKIRFVWRNKPLPFHKNAMPAALAAMEAYKQKGNDGFWKMHGAFFQDQTQLDRAGIERTATALGLDVQKVLAAVDGQTHKALIDADIKAGEDVGITGTPAFVINGYLVSGAQPLAKFKKVVNLALKEAK